MLTQELAEALISSSKAPIADSAKERALQLILDIIACASAGFATDSAQAARKASASMFGRGPASIWLAGERVALSGAIFSNCVAACALDLDEGHRLACGHPASGVISTVLALAERRSYTADEILRAVIIGYEVGVRVSAARDFSRLPTVATGQWMSYATATVAAVLMGLDAGKAAHALAIAGSHWPNLGANGWTVEKGNSVKEGIPWSAVAGVMAAELAARGFTGPRDVLNDRSIYDADVIRSGTGGDWAITRNYFKYYSACRYIHAPIDIILELRRDRDIIDAVESIDVYTYDRALKLNNYPDPPNIESAQYSIPFCLALAAIRGRDAVACIETAHLHDQLVVALARRVNLHHDPAMQAEFPMNTPARVVLRGSNWRIERSLPYCSGDWQTGNNHSSLCDKFVWLTSRGAQPEWRDAVMSAVNEFRKAGPDGLLLTLKDRARLHNQQTPMTSAYRVSQGRI